VAAFAHAGTGAGGAEVRRSDRTGICTPGQPDGGAGRARPELGPTPAALASELRALNGADILVIFVESYGAVTYDAAELAAELADARAGLEASAVETGRQVVSAFVDPPTFGASSWLSHLSLMTGVEVPNQYAYVSLMVSSRDTLPRAFRRRGYRSVALMPGMRQPWPEGAFYGFDEIYGRMHLDYQGPQFGWWSIPDQYALAKLDALERARPGRAPLFVMFPTSTTHAPFGPVPPYQPSWARILTAEPFERDDAARALAQGPDLTDLRPSYARAVAYEFDTFAGYLREHAEDDLVMILVGDHQPPAAVSGPEAPWEVPVHVVARQTPVIDHLLAHGFRRGMTPARPSVAALHELSSILMDAFDADPVTAPLRRHAERQARAAEDEREQPAEHRQAVRRWSGSCSEDHDRSRSGSSAPSRASGRRDAHLDAQESRLRR
jgi:hypothetical protein